MKQILIQSKVNLVGRDAVTFSQAFTPISGEVYLEFNDRHINAKSILGVLSAGIKKDNKFYITILNKEDNFNLLNILNKLQVIICQTSSTQEP